MEIPYIVTPRKDTGLFNSKIAIWLFLASEVMLFGGLFSAYIFLRIGADYPWPERTLPVIPGLINTFVLIASSVTVVFAWASLKLRQWGRFKLFMGITVACAVLFMALKSVEYSVKFHHQAVRLKDHTIIEGHLGYELKEGADHHHIKPDDYELDHHGNKVEENVIKIETESVTFDALRYYKPWVEELISQSHHHGSKLVLTEEIKIVVEPATDKKEAVKETLGKAGEELSLELLAKIKDAHENARGHNADLRADSLRDEWAKAKAANPGKRGWQLTEKVAVNLEAIEKQLITEIATVTFKVEPACVLHFKPRDIKEADGESKLRDATVIKGKLLPSPMGFHNVDAIDFQFLAMKAVEKGVDPMVAIENSWVMQNSQFVREAWAWHQEEIKKLEQDLIDGYGYSDELDADGNKKPNREPTFKERYRLGWKELAKMAEQKKLTNLGDWTFAEEFKGPNYEARGNQTFPAMEVPREQVAFASKFMPAWNTYYAIYFTITGLHGLHVIGGALVLAYYLLFTRKMYQTDPEWLANRVEVAGLFWHFVDLVWIFAFPIFYLM